MFKKVFIVSLLIGFFSCKKEQKETLVNNLNSKSNSSLIIDNKATNNYAKKTITFPSKDGLEVTADVYKNGSKPITILLCHQAGYSRGEYIDTAIKLNELGYSVMAIDQRSGNIANDIVNETAKRAKEKNLLTTFLDAKQDIEAAISYIYNNNENEKLTIVGSSYSATLALLIANENEKIKAVAAFSPGEYFKGMNIKEQIQGLSKPTYVTSSKKEAEALKTLVDKVNKDNLAHYIPQEVGIHGSRALWKTTKGYEAYWRSFKAFLNEF